MELLQPGRRRRNLRKSTGLSAEPYVRARHKNRADGPVPVWKRQKIQEMLWEGKNPRGDRMRGLRSASQGERVCHKDQRCNFDQSDPSNSTAQPDRMGESFKGRVPLHSGKAVQLQKG